MFQPIKKPLWQRIQERWLGRQFVERGKLGVVYGSDGLLHRLLKPGQAVKLSRWQEVRVGDISTDPFVVEEWITALSKDGFDFRAQVRLEASFSPITRDAKDEFVRLAVERCLHDNRWPGRVVVKPLVWEATVQSMGSFSAAQLLVGQIWHELEQGIQSYIEEHLPKGFVLTKLGLKQLLPPEELADMKKKSRGLWMNAVGTQEIPPDAWERLIELIMSSQRPPPPSSGNARSVPPESATWANGREPSEAPRYSARP